MSAHPLLIPYEQTSSSRPSLLFYHHPGGMLAHPTHLGPRYSSQTSMPLCQVQYFEKYDRILDEPVVQRKLPLWFVVGNHHHHVPGRHRFMFTNTCVLTSQHYFLHHVCCDLDMVDRAHPIVLEGSPVSRIEFIATDCPLRRRR